MKAILIIDMQKVSFTPATPRYKTSEVVQNINSLTEKYRKSGDLVIFIQHDGSKQDFCKPNTEEWEILDELVKLPADIIVPKEANDAFYRTKLNKILQENGVKEIAITGCATDFCVDSTIKTALTKDYDVTVVSDAHTTADREDITADKVINYFNRIWAHMIPTEGKIEVIPTNDLIS